MRSLVFGGRFGFSCVGSLLRPLRCKFLPSSGFCSGTAAERLLCSALRWKFRSGSMVWGDKLKSLFPDSNLRGRIRMKLLLQLDGIREDIFDDDDDAVKSSLLTLLEPADSAGNP